MSRFGAGFGKDLRLLDCRPCRTTQSAQNQKHFSRRLETDLFSGTSFNDPRPTWWRNEADEIFRVPSPSRLGEWRLVWRANDPNAPADRRGSGQQSHRPAWDSNEIYDMDGPAMRGYADHLNMLESREPSRAVTRAGRSTAGRSRQGRTAESQGSRRAHSSLGIVGEDDKRQTADQSQVAGRTGRLNVDMLRERHDRMGTAASQQSIGSRASRRSRASRASTDLSDTSTASIRSSEVLSRSGFSSDPLFISLATPPTLFRAFPPVHPLHVLIPPVSSFTFRLQVTLPALTFLTQTQDSKLGRCDQV